MPQPIKDESRGFRMWHISEIYIGPSGEPSQQFVPNTNDGIIDWIQGTFRVTDVDYTTGLSTTIPHSFDQPRGGILEEDALLGSSLGETREQYRMFVKAGTLPFEACLDASLKVYQVESHHIKVFKGTNTSDDTGNVISAILNSSGTVVSENVPLLLTTMINGVNYAIRTPQEFVLAEAVQDGDVCTAVVYTVDGTPIGSYKVIVLNSDFIRTTDASKKYVVGIELVSPFMSSSISNQLEYPINLPIQSGSLLGKVRYSDGTSVNLPIDGNSFELQGIDSFIASVVGQKSSLVLTYHLGANEFAYGGGSVPGDRWINENYTIRTVEAQGVYSVKLFAVPYWTNSPARWNLDWYLYSLERDAIYNVTPYVSVGVGGTAFNGTNLASRQNLLVQVNLNQVDGTFLYYQHTQSLFIRLLANGDNAAAASYWRIEYTDGNIYGDTLKAQRGNSSTGGQYTLDVANGIATLADWKAALFSKIEPLYATGSEVAPPDPTHFRIKYGATERVVPIGQYNVVQDQFTETPTQGSAIRLEFIRDVSGDILELGMASLTVKA